MKEPERVALCLFGQMRTYEKCYPYLEDNLLHVLEPDVFIHTWENIGGTLNKEENPPDELVTHDRLNDLYSPVAAEIERFDEQYYWDLDGVEVPEKVRNLPNYQKGILPMFYKMKEVTALKRQQEMKQGVEYDLVILLRPDFLLLDPIPTEAVQDPSKLWVRPRPAYKIEDQIIVSSSRAIDYYTSIWENLEKYWRTELGDEYGAIGLPDYRKYDHYTDIATPERLLHYHMEQSRIDIGRFDIDGTIVRHGEDIDFLSSNTVERMAHILVKGDTGIAGRVTLPEAALLSLKEEGVFTFAVKIMRHLANNR